MVQLFEPHKGQQDIIERFVVPDNPKWGIITTGRQFGKTLLAMNSIAYWLLNDPGALGCWITPYVNQGVKVYDEVREALSGIIKVITRMIVEMVEERLFKSLHEKNS